MFDRENINRRFLSCFPDRNPRQLAELLGITHPTVYQWMAGKSQVPWSKLKFLVDSQGVRWDWLLEGRKPKCSRNQQRGAAVPLNRHGINKRFLSLYPLSQNKMAEQFNVSQMTVYRWHHALSQIPWEKRQRAVREKGVTWEWLLEGRDG